MSNTAFAQACFTDSVYIARNHAIKVPVLLHTKSEKAEEKALLDCGATENFIHPRLVKRLQLKACPLKKARTVRNVDGTTNRLGKITTTVKLFIDQGKFANFHNFLVADIGEDDLILGYPFFEDVDPLVDWRTGTLDEEVHLHEYGDWEDLEDTRTRIAAQPKIAKTTVAQQLAEQATDKTKRSWQELVPEKYHRHGNVFLEKASEQFPKK